jgi:hypothetical protein
MFAQADSRKIKYYYLSHLYRKHETSIETCDIKCGLPVYVKQTNIKTLAHIYADLLGYAV